MSDDNQNNQENNAADKLYTQEELDNAKQEIVRKRVGVEKQKRAELEDQVKALADQISELKQANVQQPVTPFEPQQQPSTQQMTQPQVNQQAQEPPVTEADQQNPENTPDPAVQKMQEVLDKGLKGDDEFAQLAHQSAHGQAIPGDVVLKLTSQFGEKSLPLLKKSLQDEDFYYRMLDAANGNSKHAVYKLMKENAPNKNNNDVVKNAEPDLMSEGSPAVVESSTKNRLRNIYLNS